MCQTCKPEDPRDALGYCETALTGLDALLCQLREQDQVSAAHVGGIVMLIADRMRPAVEAIQHYVPRDWKPPAA